MEDNSEKSAADLSTVNKVKKLVDDLEAATKTTSKGRAYKQVFELYDCDKKVVSWKFNEWDYGRNNVRLPCNARGLFISDDAQNPEIIARGYDKFFNINEVPKTKWDWLEKNTVGAYEITLKSNGCIILISGLEDGTLVVCSKHSTGPRNDVDRNHASSGRAYLKSQLAAQGTDEKRLALRLHELNVTAVAEYCDDSFEEHILEYKGEQAGLYLHGINYNQIDFRTWPIDKVTEFAVQYGFKVTEHSKTLDMDSLKSFLEKCSRDACYKDAEVEGFVIRCKLADKETDFFFKYKFEEPYLMYRQWREVTKDYIMTRSRVFKFRKHKFITNKYLDFVIPILDNDPKICENYMKGFGILELRNMFLANYGMSGFEILNYSRIQELELKNSVDFDKVDENTKFLIFPIAVIGCGKTTTSLTLKNLYNDSWEVVQNDDITSKDKSMLMKKSLEILAKPEIKCVFVDRNNHQLRERKQLFDWLDELKEDYLPYNINIKVIGLSFFPYEDIDKVKELTVSRVLARGDNHQSIKVSTYGEKKSLGIMYGFLNRYQPVNEHESPDSLFDMMINLKILDADSSLFNASYIVKQIHKKYPVLIPKLPSHEEIKSAFEESLLYKPTIVKTFSSSNGKSTTKKFKPEFFSAAIADRTAIIQEIKNLREQYQMDACAKYGLDLLFEENKFQKEFHITLAHVIQGKKGSDSDKEIWNGYIKRYQELYFQSIKKGNKSKHLSTEEIVHFKLKKLCWNEKIISIIVELIQIEDSKTPLSSKVLCCNEVPHITIGILDNCTRPSFSNELCKKVKYSNVQGKDTHCLDFVTTASFEANICVNL